MRLTFAGLLSALGLRLTTCSAHCQACSELQSLRHAVLGALHAVGRVLSLMAVCRGLQPQPAKAQACSILCAMALMPRSTCIIDRANIDQQPVVDWLRRNVKSLSHLVSCRTVFMLCNTPHDSDTENCTKADQGLAQGQMPISCLDCLQVLKASFMRFGGR